MDERRKFFRHPVDIPIQVIPQEQNGSKDVPMSDIGAGGISFRTNIFFEKGTRLKVHIPHLYPPFEAIGVVCRHRSIDNQLEIGLMFLDEDTAFRMRMVEQVCQIEKYQEQLQVEGRSVSFQDAAYEWIEKYAADFDNN